MSSFLAVRARTITRRNVGSELVSCLLVRPIGLSGFAGSGYMNDAPVILNRQVEQRPDQRQAFERRVQSEAAVKGLVRQRRIGQPDGPGAVATQPGDRIAQPDLIAAQPVILPSLIAGDVEVMDDDPPAPASAQWPPVTTTAAWPGTISRTRPR